MAEQWKPIPGGGGRYEASDLGRIRSGGSYIMVGHPNQYGHRCVRLRLNGRVVKKQVGHLVLLAFVGRPGKGQECRHLDGVPADNRLENLSWGTKVENFADRTKHGRTVRGHRMHTSKLTERQASAVKRRSRAGESMAALSREFSVSKTAVRYIREGRNWAHLSC